MEPQSLIVRDGFRVLKTAFIVPQELNHLDSQAKRKTTICNLFINHRLAISDIARVLDESRRRAIEILIEQRIIEDRRSVPRTVKESPVRPGLASRFKKQHSV